MTNTKEDTIKAVLPSKMMLRSRLQLLLPVCGCKVCKIFCVLFLLGQAVDLMNGHNPLKVGSTPSLFPLMRSEESFFLFFHSVTFWEKLIGGAENPNQTRLVISPKDPRSRTFKILMIFNTFTSRWLVILKTRFLEDIMLNTRST